MISLPQLFIGESFNKVLPIIFLVDSSLSMDENSELINKGIKKAIDILKNRIKELDLVELDVKVTSLEFAENCIWKQEKKLIPINEFQWTDFKPKGCSNFKKALCELEQSISRKSLLQGDCPFLRPLIILFSDGMFTDDWVNELNRINAENKWMKHSVKVAFSVGINAEKESLVQFTGHSETVFTVNSEKQIVESIMRILAGLFVGSSRYGVSDKFIYGELIGMQDTEQDDGWGDDDDWQ